MSSEINSQLLVRKLTYGCEYFNYAYGICSPSKVSNRINESTQRVYSSYNVVVFTGRKYNNYSSSPLMRYPEAEGNNTISYSSYCLNLGYYADWSNIKFAKISMSDKVSGCLKKIKKSFDKKSIEYKISSILLSSLPVHLSNLNSIGYLLTYKGELYSFNKRKMLNAPVPFNLNDDNFEKYIVPTKIGGVIRQATGEMFSHLDIQKFTDAFTFQLKDFSEYKIEVVSGKDIINWYNAKNYNKSVKGTLHRSCMRYHRNGDSIAFYAFHPKVKMVIVHREGKLYARALLWETLSGLYLDRIYSSDAVTETLLEKWAFKNYKITANYANLSQSNFDTFVLIETDFKQIFTDGSKNGYGTIRAPYFDSIEGAAISGKYLIIGGLDLASSYVSLTDYVDCGGLITSIGRVDNFIDSIIEEDQCYFNQYKTNSLLLTNKSDLMYVELKSKSNRNLKMFKLIKKSDFKNFEKDYKISKKIEIKEPKKSKATNELLVLDNE